MDGVSGRAKRRWLLRWSIAQCVALWLAAPLIPYVAGAEPTEEGWYGRALGSPLYASWIAGFAAAFALLQWLYLRPVRAPEPAKKPVSLVWSMVLGGFVVSVLLLGVALAVLGYVHDVLGVRPYVIEDEEALWMLLWLLGLNWLLATPLLLHFARRSQSDDDHLRRVATVLFAGTLVELLAVLPLDLLARRKDDCWCFRGTLLAICVALVAGLILVGPVVFLVLLARRRRRWPGGKCGACGADVGEDLRIARCPACGSGWAE